MINVGQHPWLLAAGCWLLPCCRRRSWCELPSLPLFDFFVFLLPASAGLLPCFAPNAPHAQVGLPHFHPLPPRLGRRHVSPTASCPASRRGHDRQDCRSESWWGLHWWAVAALVVGGQEQAAPLSQALRPQPHWVGLVLEPLVNLLGRSHWLGAGLPRLTSSVMSLSHMTERSCFLPGFSAPQPSKSGTLAPG